MQLIKFSKLYIAAHFKKQAIPGITRNNADTTLPTLSNTNTLFELLYRLIKFEVITNCCKGKHQWHISPFSIYKLFYYEI